MAITYATRDEVALSAGGDERLCQLTDYDKDGEEDDGVVDGAIEEAESIVNSYVRKVYDVPLSPVPPSINTRTRSLTVWILKARRDAITEADQLKHDEDIKWLEELSKGKVDAGITPSPTASARNIAGSSERPSSKIVSRKNMEGFS